MPGARVVFGKVVAATNGSPIAGAAVSVTPGGAGGTTDANGGFEIESKHGAFVRCAVRAPGVGVALGPWLPFGTGERLDAGTFRIEPRAGLVGRVVDPGGAPVAEADVSVVREGPASEEWEALLGAFGFQVTGDDGRFSFEGLDDAPYRLSVTVYDPTADDDSRRTMEHVRAGGDEIVFVIPFARKRVRGTIAVSVTLPDGRPLPWGTLRCSAGGSYESAPIRAGQGSATIDGPGPARVVINDAWDDNNMPLPYRPAFLHDVIPRNEPYAIVLEPGETIDALVTTLDGAPMKAAVTFWPHRLDDRSIPHEVLYGNSVECGADGRCRSPGLPPGEYSLTAACNGYAGVRPYVVARTGAKDVRIEMRRAGRIRLLVVAPEGQVLGGGSFTLLAPTSAGHVDGGTSTVSCGNSKTSSFEVAFDGLREGDVYRVRGSVAGRGFGRYTPFELDVVAGDGRPVEVRVRPGRMLVGRVTREGRGPVAAAEVRVRLPLPPGQDENQHWSADHGQPSAVSGLDGRFELLGVPDGAFWLSCVADGLAQPGGPRVVAPSDHEIEIRLVPALEVSGRVVGDPPLDFRMDWIPAQLAGEAASIPRDYEFSGADGFFALRGLPPGRVRLDGWRPSGEDDDRYVQAEGLEAGATDLRLTILRGCRIEGTVKDRDGQQVVMATVVVEAPWGVRRAITDEQGRFALRALPPGRHLLRVRTAQGVGDPVPVDAPGPPVNLVR